MPELIRWEGTSGGLGIARDLWSDVDDAQHVMAVFQTNMPVGDDELNIVQHLALEAQQKLARGLVSDGLASGGGFVTTDTLTPPIANTFYLQSGVWILDHIPIIVADSRNNGTTLNLNQAVTILTDAPPSGVTPRTDVIMLEFWFEEVASPGQSNASTTVHERGGEANLTLVNDIQNLYLGAETARRVQARWRIRTISGVSTIAGQIAWGALNPNSGSALTYALMPNSTAVYRAGSLSADTVRSQGTLTDANTLSTVNGFSYAIQIATLLRQPNVTTITQATITQTAPLCDLLIQVPRASIYPPIPDPLPGETSYPISYSYDGDIVDTTNTGAGAATGLDVQSLASSFTIAQPSGSATNSYSLTRIELWLSATGTGADTIIDVVPTIGGAPTGAPLVSFTLPKEWLTSIPRAVSVPLPVALLYGSTYWVRAHQAGTSGNHTVWQTHAPADPTSGRAQVTNDPTLSSGWTASATLFTSVYTDNNGSIRHVITGGLIDGTAELYEYANDSIIYIGEAQYASSAVSTATLAAVAHDSGTGAITSITQVNP